MTGESGHEVGRQRFCFVVVVFCCCCFIYIYFRVTEHFERTTKRNGERERERGV